MVLLLLLPKIGTNSEFETEALCMTSLGVFSTTPPDVMNLELKLGDDDEVTKSYHVIR